jgi:hypothetical protein
MLAYTGKDGSIINNAPPAIGAIIPPLRHHSECMTKQSRGGTYIRESAEAAPQAVPRTGEIDMSK